METGRPEGNETKQIRPDYYRVGTLECFDILSWMADDAFNLCNAVKYVFRAGNKGDEVEDLRKALTCLEEGKDYQEANIRDVFQSGLPYWKKRIIVELMEMTRYDYGDYRNERYDVIIDDIRERIEHISPEEE